MVAEMELEQPAPELRFRVLEKANELPIVKTASNVVSNIYYKAKVSIRFIIVFYCLTLSNNLKVFCSETLSLVKIEVFD